MRRGMGKGKVSKYLKTIESRVHRKPHGCKHNILDIQYLCACRIPRGKALSVWNGEFGFTSCLEVLDLKVEASRVLSVRAVRGKPSSFPSCSMEPAWLDAVFFPGCSRGKLVLAPLFSPQTRIGFVLEPGSWPGSAPRAAATLAASRVQWRDLEK